MVLGWICLAVMGLACICGCAAHTPTIGETGTGLAACLSRLAAIEKNLIRNESLYQGCSTRVHELRSEVKRYESDTYAEELMICQDKLIDCASGKQSVKDKAGR